MERWVKLYDKLLEWEWFTDSSMVHLFMYLLLKANTGDSVFHGVHVTRGQIITTFKRISADTHISVQTLRTCFRRMERTGEIHKETIGKLTLITINGYDKYQPTPAPKPATPPVTAEVEQQPVQKEQPQQEPFSATVNEDAPMAEQSYEKLMVSDSYWCEVMCMRHHLQQADLKKLVVDFFVDQQCRGHPKHDNLRDAKNHFNSWLLIRNKDNGSIKDTARQKAYSDRRGTEPPNAGEADYHSGF